MFTPSREEARRFFFETWRKHRAAQPLQGLESTAITVILLHPEYQPLLDDPVRNLDRDYTPDSGALNPFLHLSLHLAVEEQLQLDQPPGISAEFRRLAAATGDEHDARHDILECLGETVWEAQRSGTPPDGHRYLNCLRRKRPPHSA